MSNNLNSRYKELHRYDFDKIIGRASCSMLNVYPLLHISTSSVTIINDSTHYSFTTSLRTMPGLLESTDNSDFKIVKIEKLHETFGAQISGVDFSSPISDEVFHEILAAITKVNVQIPTS